MIDQERPPEQKPNRLAVTATFFVIVAIAMFAVGLSLLQKQRTRQLLADADQTRAAAEATLPSVTVTSQPTPVPLPIPKGRIISPIRRAGSYPGEPSGDIVDYLVDRFVLGYARGIRVCENLAAQQPDIPGSMVDLENGIRASQGSGGVSDNRFVESALIPIATALEMPSLGTMVELVQTAKNMQDPRPVNSDDFRTTVSLAAAEAVGNRAELSHRAQHAYHLFVLSRAATLAPAIANGGATLSLCSHEQLLATSSATQTREQLDADKAALLRLLASAGLSPDQVGYDPNMANEVEVAVNARSISIAVPWMTKQFGAPFRIENAFANSPEIISGATTGAASGAAAGTTSASGTMSGAGNATRTRSSSGNSPGGY